MPWASARCLAEVLMLTFFMSVYLFNATGLSNRVFSAEVVQAVPIDAEQPGCLGF